MNIICLITNVLWFDPSCKKYKTALEDLSKVSNTGGEDSSQATRCTTTYRTSPAQYSHTETDGGLVLFPSLVLFLSSAAESRVKGSPARPSESASAQQSRSSSDADPLSRRSRLVRKKPVAVSSCF